MPSEPYIAIGSRGTIIIGPRELHSTLHEGINALPWPTGKSRQIWENYAGWIANSKTDKTYELYRLSDALAKGRVQRRDVQWKWADGVIHDGEAFLHPDWRDGEIQPRMVAVRYANGGFDLVGLEPHPDSERDGGKTGRFISGLSSTPFGQPSANKSHASPWTRDELLIVLNMYYKLPFSEIRQQQPVVVDLARRLNRSPRSIFMKLQDFALLDTSLGSRRLTITQSPSAQDRSIWDEFQTPGADAIPESEELLRQKCDVDENSDLEISVADGIRVYPRSAPNGPTERLALTRQRCKQEYFRGIVLKNCGYRCVVTGLAIPELLVASHILPWSAHPAHQIDVQNGLCLSRLIDAAFDRHLLSFDSKLRLVLSPRLERAMIDPVVTEQLSRYVGKPLQLPSGAKSPNPAFLAQHQALALQNR